MCPVMLQGVRGGREDGHVPRAAGGGEGGDGEEQEEQEGLCQQDGQRVRQADIAEPYKRFSITDVLIGSGASFPWLSVGLRDAVKICGLPAVVDPQAADAAAALGLCAARDLARSFHCALLRGLQVELEGPDVTRRATD